MSLHVDLSSEAIQRLHAERRNATISSAAIALLAVVLVALILAFFLLPSAEPERPQVEYFAEIQPTKTEPAPPKVPIRMESNPSSPSQNMANVLVANTISPTAIPTMEVEISTPSLELGSGDDFGSDWISGDQSSNQFDSIPKVMQKRCSKEDRLARLQESGGNEACEDAVVKALDWFKATQSADGSWTQRNQTAMTGLALLAYLGHCETPRSHEYGDTVVRAMTYLINIGLKNDGKLAVNPVGNSWPYEHAISTYALAEAATFCKQGNIPVPDLFEVTQKAGQLIIDSQNQNGGWAYAYATTGGHTDLSVAAWQIQALKACKHTDIEFKGLTRAAGKAMNYVDSLQSKDGGFGYSKAGETHATGYCTLTGAGLLSLQMWDKGDGASARRSANYIMKNTKFEYNGVYSDLYGHYYEAQAMMNRGGKQWSDYNGIFRDQLLKNQNADGSWKAPNSQGGGKIRAVAPQFTSNAHYRTALCTLMLEVYYRFLPGTSAQ